MSTDRSLRELMSLEGRVALVTGGAGHIGRVIAGGLAELGANIAVVDISASGGAEVAAKLGESWPVKAEMFDCDFEQSAAVQELPRTGRVQPAPRDSDPAQRDSAGARRFEAAGGGLPDLQPLATADRPRGVPWELVGWAEPGPSCRELRHRWIPMPAADRQPPPKPEGRRPPRR